MKYKNSGKGVSLIAGIVVLAINMLVFCQIVFASVRCPTKAAIDESNIARYYESSVFKVYKLINGVERAIGTATLIDSRGYFLTASHITELQEEYEKDGSQVYTRPLILKNKSIGKTLQAEEIVHCACEQLDVAILKASLTKEDIEGMQQIPSVDVMTTAPDYGLFGCKVAMLGYKLDDDELIYHHFLPIGQIRKPKYSTFFLVTGGAWHGQSGSAALNDEGLLVGIMHGPRDCRPKPIQIYFTIVSEARKELATIPPTDRVKKLLSQLKKGSMSSLWQSVLSRCQLSNLEALSLRAEIESSLRQGLNEFNDGVRAYYDPIFTQFYCNEMVEEVEWLAANFATLAPLTVSVATDTARILFKKYQALNKCGAAGEEVEHLIQTCLMMFERATDMIPKRKEGRRSVYYSNIFYDYALALKETKGLSDAEVLGKMAELLGTSLRYNESNWKTYSLASELFNSAERPVLARYSAAKASQLAASQAKLQEAKKPATSATLKRISDSLAMEGGPAREALASGRVSHSVLRAEMQGAFEDMRRVR